MTPSVNVFSMEKGYILSFSALQLKGSGQKRDLNAFLFCEKNARYFSRKMLPSDKTPHKYSTRIVVAPGNWIRG